VATAAVLSPDGSPPLFGRHATIEEILGHLQRARSGRGRALLLVGEGGVGKSTMLHAAADLGRGLEFRVLEGRARPAEPPEPYGLMRTVLKAALAEREERDHAAHRATPTLPMFLAPYEDDPEGEAARATGLAEKPAEAREAGRLLDHLADPPDRITANRSSLFARLGEFIDHLTEERPLLLVLDDLQFADDSTLEFLKEYLPSIGESRLVVLASAVPPGEAPPRTRDALAALPQGRTVTALTLRPMNESELGEYVRWLLHGRDPGREALMRWFTQTDGNPLFTEYLVRASTGLARTGAAPDDVGQDFGEVVKARIGLLPEAERRLLVYASVIGREFDFPTVAAASGKEEERLSESLDHLVRDGIIREKGGEVYEFVSERARADVYAQLTETRRRLLHRKVAGALEARSGGETSDVYELARQFYLGREDDKAVEYNRRAADLATKSYAFDAAFVHLERALESLRRLSPRRPSEEILLLVELGRHLDELGDLKRSEAVLLDAVARARTDPALDLELGFALLGLAQARADLAEYASGRDIAQEAFPILERHHHDRGLMAAHRVLGVALWRLGDLGAAERHQRAELALAEAHGTPVDVGHALVDLANTFTPQAPARTAEALQLYERAAALFADSGDHSARARVMMNLALMLHYADRRAEALPRMQEALRSAELSRSRIWIGYVSLNLSQFYAERRDLDRARIALDHARENLEPMGDQLAHQQLTMIEGIIAAEDSRYADAERFYVEAAALARQLNLLAESAEMEFRFADLEARRGRGGEARTRLAAARSAGIERYRADLMPRLRELEGRLAAAA